MRHFHMRWFKKNIEPDVIIRDLSDTFGGFSLNGPNSRDILEKVTNFPISEMKMMECAEMDLDLFRVKVSRISLSGELAFEINCLSSEHAGLRDLLLRAGKTSKIKEIGFDAMLSLRLEKSIGIWNADFTQSYTPSMTGLDKWCDWSKNNFIGCNSNQGSSKSVNKLAMLEIESNDADATGFEPVWVNVKVIGITTSGGYGHRMKKSYALAMLDTNYIEIDRKVFVHIVGQKCQAKIVPLSPYDPTGERMRM